jgi:hypothetical protein
MPDALLPSTEALAAFFRRGGRIGVLAVASESDKALAVCSDASSSPFSSLLFPGFAFCFCFFIVSSRAWYKLAATMMASSEEAHTKPWHSNVFRPPGLRMTQANNGG